MNKELEVATLVSEKFSTREIASKLNISQTNVRYWMNKLGLESYYTNKPIICEKCGETDIEQFYGWKKTLCKVCVNESAVVRFRNNKKRQIEYKGGKCERCGYDKCQAALAFHHKDPTQKDPKWKTMKGWKFEKVKEEIDKCMLVCHNCHSELHYLSGIEEF